MLTSTPLISSNSLETAATAESLLLDPIYNMSFGFSLFYDGLMRSEYICSKYDSIVSGTHIVNGIQFSVDYSLTVNELLIYYLF
jgi:ammonia channel protein AmtB